MNELNYFTINRYELTNRILADEINKVNSEKLQRRNFVDNNNVFKK